MSEKTKQPTFTAGDEAGAREAAEAQLAAQAALEPAGDQRREDLAKKAEKLLEAANALLAQIDIETADPDALEIDNEVRQALNDLNEVYVSNMQPEYAYAWIFRDAHNEYGGRHVRKMQALGYEVVQGEMPEAREHRFVDGTRVVADCLLMRVRVDRKMLLDKRDRLLREAQQAGVMSRIQELAERANTRVYDKLPGFVEDAIAGQARANRQQVRARALRDFHHMNQGGKLDRMIKTGQIPGIPSPGAGAR